MSSGFVSAGTDQEPVERDDEWLRVQQELEEERRLKAEHGKQDGGKSLFEVLQNNKMAKQEAFEEKIKLKNQFRALDEDEVEFLDSLMESTRAQEATVKKETAEQLELFRRQREEVEKAFLADTSADVVPAEEGEDWKIPTRKRRREKEFLIPGKKRKSVGEASADNSISELKGSKQATEIAKDSPQGRQSETQGDSAVDENPKVPVRGSPTKTSIKATGVEALKQPPEHSSAQPPSFSLGLSGYSSDSE